MKSTTSIHTIEKLRHCFATFGLPTTLVSDNGPQFRSVEFKEFLKANGIHHTFTPPYHPASNGLAERAVQTVKDIFLKQMLQDARQDQPRSLQHRIDSFLFTYRNTPHTITGVTPAEAMLKFRPKTHLSLLKPHLSSELDIKHEGIVKSANAHRGKPRQFNIHDQVFVRTVRNEKINWQSGTIVKVISQVTYLVRVEGRTRFVHVDHLRTNISKENEDEEDITLQFPREMYQSPKNLKTPEVIGQETPNKRNMTPSPIKSPQVSPNRPTASKDTSTHESISLRRSHRPRRAPQKLDL